MTPDDLDKRAADTGAVALGVHVRPAQRDELPHILATWKRSLVDTWAHPRGLSTREAYAILNPAIDGGAVPRAAFLVALLQCDERIIVGWIAQDKGRLLYAYVKPRFRKLGVFERLKRNRGLRWEGFDPFVFLEELWPSRRTG